MVAEKRKERGERLVVKKLKEEADFFCPHFSVSSSFAYAHYLPTSLEAAFS